MRQLLRRTCIDLTTPRTALSVLRNELLRIVGEERATVLLITQDVEETINL